MEIGLEERLRVEVRGSWSVSLGHRSAQINVLFFGTSSEYGRPRDDFATWRSDTILRELGYLTGDIAKVVPDCEIVHSHRPSSRRL